MCACGVYTQAHKNLKTPTHTHTHTHTHTDLLQVLDPLPLVVLNLHLCLAHPLTPPLRFPQLHLQGAAVLLRAEQSLRRIHSPRYVHVNLCIDVLINL
jgi:hypothetical protein